ncbi:hypothetical protein JM18_000957 [Phytophthora kernoviae]|uniref:G-patch domain-containing protein n=1 Tax=Phytophthora kernoviae TaxID=325452 RepID=A0A8T0LRZ5_9STRA|nr:hypothetical protein JM16_005539 [Phytophthora kernoviae]KAG2531726.1 hypothetical protein JM18_000957 [Phytophthora kernoviae]
MTEISLALESASRRELQSLAKDLQLCRGNAKSDVIITHAKKFLDDHPTDGEAIVLAALGSSGNMTPVASPASKKVVPKKKEKKAVATVKADSAKKSKSSKQQPEDEPVVTADSVEIKQKTPTKKISSSNKKETKQTPSPAPISKTAASKKASGNNNKPSPAKVKTSANKEPTPSKKTTAINKKATATARKAVVALVNHKKDLSFVGETRVRCSITGHEMKADLEIIKAYINGKRYLKAYNLKTSFASYAPMFVAHPDESQTDLLWCNVTETAIARDPESVKTHIAAPKYLRQLPLWKEQEAAKKKAEEEEAQRRAARIKAAKKRRLAAASGDGADAPVHERPAKRDAALPFSRHSDVLHGHVPTDPTEIENLVAELKRRGNAAFQQKALEEAEVLYTRAITVNESNPLHNQHIFFANRSAARCSMGKLDKALEDADACVTLDPTYAKGFFRKAQALVKLGRYKEALTVLDNAKALEPSNKSVTTLYSKVQELSKKEKEAPAAPTPKKVVTRVEVTETKSNSSSTAAAGASSKAPTSSAAADDDADIVGHVRGYKKLADGRVTTFFNNELTEEAKQLIGDIAPKKVENANKVQIKNVDGGSAWNQGNTFEEKDMTSWAKDKLEKIVSGISAPLGSGEGVVTSLEVRNLEGDASIAMVRGAKRYIFDFTFTLAVTLKQTEGSVAGELRFLDLSSDCGGDYDVEAVVPSRYQSANGKNMAWAADTSKFGFKMLVKMGWSAGKGVGKDLQGQATHVKIARRSENLGVGCSLKQAEVQGWSKTAGGFADVLKTLNASYGNNSGEDGEASDASLPTKSKKSKKSKKEKKAKKDKKKSKKSKKSGAEKTTVSRKLHYRKRQTNKDAKNYGAAEMAAILGVASSSYKPTDK